VSLGLAAFGLAILALTVLAFGSELLRHLRPSGRALRHLHSSPADYDRGRERHAEQKAAELMRSVVGEENYAMYEELGFLRVRGASAGYAYLIYPHRPLLVIDEASGALLNEYCVGFPDRSDPREGTRLPDSDDVLAKWMALIGDERSLISDANIHLPGRQVDPEQVRRDLGRLREWDAQPNNLPA